MCAKVEGRRAAPRVNEWERSSAKKLDFRVVFEDELFTRFRAPVNLAAGGADRAAFSVPSEVSYANEIARR